MNPIEEIVHIANLFLTDGAITDAVPHGSGNINDTYLITSDTGKQYILQKVNTSIFTAPQRVMSNMSKVTSHISRTIKEQKLEWKIQCVVSAKGGENYLNDPELGFWRMITLIGHSRSFDVLESEHQAFELGRALGEFHTLLDSLPDGEVEYVLDGFHVVPHYLELYDEASLLDNLPTGTLVDHAHRLIDRFRVRGSVLEEGREKGVLPLRIIHGDPKINNIMFDIDSGNAISMIDLDTIQPGLLHYDIGDCARSSCNPLGEEEREHWADVKFDIEVFRLFWQGYRSNGLKLLSPDEVEYVYDSLFVIAFEMGLRFFTDYLNGDIYFKTSYPENNLYRALVQLTLAESIDAQKEEIEAIINEESR